MTLRYTCRVGRSCAALVVLLVAVSVQADVPPALWGKPVERVEVEGVSLPARDVGIPLGAPLTRRLLRTATQRLIATGRYSNVQIDVAPEGGGVTIHVLLAPRIVLVRVDVRGNTALDDLSIRRELNLDRGSELDVADLPAVELRLGELYGSRGYASAMVRAELRPTDDPARRVLVLHVEEGEPTRIRGFVFEGEALPNGRGVRGAIDLDAGDQVDRDVLEAAFARGQARLRELGYLEAALRVGDIEPKNDGVVAHVRSHIGPLYQVIIRGHGQVPRTDILAALRVGEERPRPGVLLAMEERATQLVRRYGFPHALVSVRRVQVPERSAIAIGPGVKALLLVDVKSGDAVEVQTRSYPGSSHFEPAFFDEQVDAFLDEAISEAGPLEPLDTHIANRLLSEPQQPRTVPAPLHVEAAKTWYEPAYAAATEHLRELYRADGFLEATVGPARLEPLRDGFAHVVIPVVEGPRTRLHRLVITGNVALGSRAVAEHAELSRGQPFGYLALERAAKRIVDAYRELGFYYATIEHTVMFSGDRTRAEVQLKIVERYEVRIGDVRIDGLNQTSESLVRRVLPLSRDALLTPQVLRRAQERLVDLGVFDGVSVVPEHEDLPARVKNILVVVHERRTQYLDFTFGVSTAQGARFGVEYGFRDVFGTALQVSARAQFGYQFFFLDETLERRFNALSLGDRLERRVALVFAAPYVGIPDVRTSLSFSHQRENERAFGLTKNVIDLTFTWQPRRLFGLSVGGDIENNDVGVLGSESYEMLLAETTDLRLRQLLRVPEGTSTLVATTVTASLDLRDNPFTPRKGFFASVSAEYARTLRPAEIVRDGERLVFDSHHVRLIGTFNGYIPLGSKLVLATQLRVGRVVHLTSDSKTYPNRQFFLGGVDTLRGYLQDSLVPQDLAEEIRENPGLSTAAVVQGGDVFMVLRAELRFPIFGEVAGGAFVDLGNSWIDTGGRPFQSGGLNPLELRPTAGLGLRINTPVGPIAFDYGILLARRTYLDEPFGSFHFSIGLF